MKLYFYLFLSNIIFTYVQVSEVLFQVFAFLQFIINIYLKSIFIYILKVFEIHHKKYYRIIIIYSFLFLNMISILFHIEPGEVNSKKLIVKFFNFLLNMFYILQ